MHHYVNLGIAAATPRGLIVPNIKEAQDLSLLELAQALEQLTITARDGKSTSRPTCHPAPITITNLGSYGMDTGTPILNPGEVAHRRARRDQAEALGDRRRGAPGVRDDGGGELRPSRGGRRCRQPLHGGRRDVLEEPALLLD